MLKPDDATLNRVRGTFLDFLKREDLEPMKVIFKSSQELTGLQKCKNTDRRDFSFWDFISVLA